VRLTALRGGNRGEKVERPAGRYNRRTPGSVDDITALLLSWGRGDEAALQQLIPLVHRELHQIARGCLKGERPGHTLQPTALVNEAFLRLVDVRRVDWKNRTHFLAMSARLMRRVLVDFARSRQYQKRGGGALKVSLDEAHGVSTERGQDLVALDEALTALSAIDERKARVIEMRFFGGLTVEETAAVLDVSRDTVLRDWRLARAWLMRELLKSEN
jgi:RNA polymerase sigma-70 factor, ECF subfamily